MIKKIIDIAYESGKAILEVYYSKNFGVEIKSDNSPLTFADKISNDIITKQLKKFFPSIPILSEEGKEISYEVRKKWTKFFLVDPLDGTKEFINRNGEFTVNIALIENNIPVLGVIYVPVSDEVYYGNIKDGAFKISKDKKLEKISVSSVSLKDELNVVQSRSHSGDEENNFYSKFKIKEKISKGSSLKICLVAEGKAELYFRGGPTWEWDTAAGHAILSAAGGHFVNKDKSELFYNKEDLKHFGFIASSSKIN